ncbi:MAG: hypothetical protein QGI11_01715, partial [Nitrospinota bacterium]|nr:hypothetical protein [Nitrospinota bacterium]
SQGLLVGSNENIPSHGIQNDIGTIPIRMSENLLHPIIFRIIDPELCGDAPHLANFGLVFPYREMSHETASTPGRESLIVTYCYDIGTIPRRRERST